MSTISIFGDASTATYISSIASNEPFIDHFQFYTDGSAAESIILPLSGTRKNLSPSLLNKKTTHLIMDGKSIYSLVIQNIPSQINNLFQKYSLNRDKFKFVFFHQANKYMIESLQQECGFNSFQCPIYLEEVGNTVSCSIPLCIENAMKNSFFNEGDLALVVGFGVGFSSAICSIKI